MSEVLRAARLFCAGAFIILLALMLASCGQKNEPQQHAPTPAPIEQRSAPVAPPVVVAPVQWPPLINAPAPSADVSAPDLPKPVVVQPPPTSVAPAPDDTPAPLPPKRRGKKGKRPHLEKHAKTLPYQVKIPQSALTKRKARKK